MLAWLRSVCVHLLMCYVSTFAEAVFYHYPHRGHHHAPPRMACGVSWHARYKHARPSSRSWTARGCAPSTTRNGRPGQSLSQFFARLLTRFLARSWLVAAFFFFFLDAGLHCCGMRVPRRADARPLTASSGSSQTIATLLYFAFVPCFRLKRLLCAPNSSRRASDADVGWGAWSVESGWTQSWITIVLGMRVSGVAQQLAASSSSNRSSSNSSSSSSSNTGSSNNNDIGSSTSGSSIIISSIISRIASAAALSESAHRLSMVALLSLPSCVLLVPFCRAVFLARLLASLLHLLPSVCAFCKWSGRRAALT